jgi:hypothetical protein
MHESDYLQACNNYSDIFKMMMMMMMIDSSSSSYGIKLNHS